MHEMGGYIPEMRDTCAVDSKKGSLKGSVRSDADGLMRLMI